MLNGDENKNSKKKKKIGLIRYKIKNFALAAHFFVHFFAVVVAT